MLGMQIYSLACELRIQDTMIIFGNQVPVK